jgi:hypothetical protein
MLTNFWLPSIFMGLGIAIDVAIATLARFRDPSMTFKSWTMPVAIAHILLPAIGYYTWWGLGEMFVFLTLPLGILAFAMISVFIHEAFCEWTDVEPRLSLGPVYDKILSCLGKRSKGRIIIVLAVSMDALWSGPAKSAQAISGNWDWLLVVASFFIAGIVVATVSEFSLLIAKWLSRISFSDINTLTNLLVMGKYFEAVILFGFGVLALWNAFRFWIGSGSLLVCIFISLTVMTVIWALNWNKLILVQKEELQS